MREWISMHVHFRGPLYEAPADFVLKKVLAPVLRRERATRRVRTAFVVRYGEHGPHWRVRLLPSEPHEQSAIRAQLHRVCREFGKLSLEARSVSYEPEFDRYGGVAAMPVVEGLFGSSSRLVLRSLGRSEVEHRDRRMGLAAVAMLLQLYVFGRSRSEAATELEHYHRGYLHRLNLHSEGQWGRAVVDTLSRQPEHSLERFSAVWETFAAWRRWPASWVEYATALRRGRRHLTALAAKGVVAVHGRPCPDWDSTAAAIGPSLMHMTNNRFGITIAEETLLAAALSGTLR